jgi:hypothetical protein
MLDHLFEEEYLFGNNSVFEEHVAHKEPSSPLADSEKTVVVDNVSDLVFLIRERTRDFCFKATVSPDDYDKNFADKLNPEDPDDTPLTKKHYANLCEFGEMIAHLYVITTRGAKSVANYCVEQWGPITNTSVASNAGFWLVRSGSSEREILPVPGYTEERLNQAVSAIREITGELQKKYPEWIKEDVRELCGTVLVTCPEGEDSKLFKEFKADVERLVKEKEEKYSIKIVHPEKFFKGGEGGKEWHGYIDFKPEGLEKELSTAMLIEDEAYSYGIGSGDSHPDYGIFKALKTRFGDTNALCIALGNDILKYERKELGVSPKDSLIDIVIKSDGKHSPVEMLHIALESIHSPVSSLLMAIQEAPVRRDVRKGGQSLYGASKPK